MYPLCKHWIYDSHISVCGWGERKKEWKGGRGGRGEEGERGRERNSPLSKESTQKEWLKTCLVHISSVFH